MPRAPQPIKAKLAERRITNRWLGQQVGVNAHTLGRIINGQVLSWPKLRRRCAQVLGLPETELFRELDR